MKYQQLEGYRELMRRTLELTLQGMRSPEVAETLEREGFRSAKIRKRISDDMVKKLLATNECLMQLHNPDLAENHWRTEDLADLLKIKEKKLKDWVTRGWVTAVQRPFGRTWVVYADKAEQQRLRQLVASQSGQGCRGPQENLRTPAAINQKPQ
jgi:hypothetical protein